MANTKRIRTNQTIDGTLAVGGTLSVAGASSLAAVTATTFSASGAAQFPGGITGGIVVAGNSTFDDNLTVDGDLTVNGSFSFAGGSVFADNTFAVQDNGDATKQVMMSVGGATTGTTSTLTFAQTANRVITFPDADLTVVGTATSQTITNKTIDADSNTISNIDDANIKSGADIARSKLLAGTASHVVINDGSGVLSSEAQLSPLRGGTGQDFSASTGVIKASAGAFTASTIVNADIDAGAAIQRSKINVGSANHVLINGAGGAMSSETSLAETRGGTAQTSYTTGDTLYASASNTISKRAIGTAGQISKVSNSLVPAWEDAVDPAAEVRLYEDWIADSTGALRWLSANNGGAGAGEATGSTLVDASHPGVVEMTTGTTTTGRTGRTLGGTTTAATTGYVVGGGKIVQEWLVYIQDLATVGEDYLFFVGSANNVVGQTDGIYFQYQRSTNTNWVGITRSASTNTTLDTGVAAAEDVWIKLRIEVNAAGTSVEFFINGVSVGTNATNIPSVFIAPIIRATKSAGTTARLFYCDYFKQYQRLTASR